MRSTRDCKFQAHVQPTAGRRATIALSAQIGRMHPIDPRVAHQRNLISSTAVEIGRLITTTELEWWTVPMSHPSVPLFGGEPGEMTVADSLFHLTIDLATVQLAVAECSASQSVIAHYRAELAHLRERGPRPDHYHQVAETMTAVGEAAIDVFCLSTDDLDRQGTGTHDGWTAARYIEEVLSPYMNTYLECLTKAVPVTVAEWQLSPVPA